MTPHPHASTSHDPRAIRAFLPMGVDGVGPSQTCLNILRGARHAGFEVELFANRCRLQDPGVPLHVALPTPFHIIPYAWLVKRASRKLEAQFFDRIKPQDVAYVWPAASLHVHRELRARGVPIILEAINTRMASAKKILDAAYEEFGAPAAHGITQQMIDEEEEKYDYTDAIFAANRHVELALAGSPLEQRFISSSYGTDIAKGGPPRETYRKEGGLTFMFCGLVCVRKGVHFLLEAWKSMPKAHRLLLVGQVEPVIAERYSDLLASRRVEVTGFQKDVHPSYAKADVFVFPTLEEGGPQVVYEAASHGLPIVTTPMGAGRLEGIEGAFLPIEPQDVTGLRDTLANLAEAADLREKLGRTAHGLAPAFDWSRVGAQRAQLIQDVVETLR